VSQPNPNESTKDTGKDDGSNDGTGAESTAETKVEDKSTSDDTSNLKKALNAERQRAAKAEKALKDAELAKLPELEQLKTRTADLERDNQRLSIENRQLKIGLDLKLPSNVAARLKGETEEEMRSDATELLKHFKAESEADNGKQDKNDGRKPANDGKKVGPTGKPDMNALLRAAIRGG
jgi:hypothetical protein